MDEQERGRAAREDESSERETPHRLTEEGQQIGRRDDEPREGESPAEPPREEPPAAEEADVAPTEPWHQVPNPGGQAGIPWEEMRKGARPDDDQTPEQRLWDDRGASEPQQVDHPKKTWGELPEQTERPEEKISTE